MGRSALHVQFSDWLNERVGQTFNPGTPEWEAVVLLFEERRKWSAWVAAADAIRVVRNDRGHPGVEFLTSERCRAVTPDDEECVPGMWRALSWAACFAPNRSRRRPRLLTAMRAAVQPQIDAFRGSVRRPACCPVTGEALGSDAQVDHIAPSTFAALVDAYLDQFGTPELATESAHHGPRLKEPAAWQAFHAERARLRWVSPRGNQQAKCS